MIRYAAPVRHLLGRIKEIVVYDTDRVNRDWLKRARRRTGEFRRRGKYVENDADLKPFWNELTPLYLEIQQNKCIYCERTLGDPVYGRVEMNIEHYRPKQGVHAWPSTYMRNEYPHLAHYGAARGDDLPDGYWTLAYHPLNLAVSCLRCNLRVKKSYFPIDATRIVSEERDLQAYHPEAPDLFYPLSTVDPDDPEACITFRGPIAFPSPHVPVRARERARVTIDLLHLNQRSELIRERSRSICLVYTAYKLTLSNHPAERRAGQQSLTAATNDRAPHANCSRCFLTLCQQDIETASMFFFEAVKRI